MISAILFLSFFVFLILGIPIGICLGLSSICAILYSGTSLTIVATVPILLSEHKPAKNGRSIY